MLNRGIIPRTAAGFKENPGPSADGTGPVPARVSGDRAGTGPRSCCPGRLGPRGAPPSGIAASPRGPYGAGRAGVGYIDCTASRSPALRSVVLPPSPGVRMPKSAPGSPTLINEGFLVTLNASGG